MSQSLQNWFYFRQKMVTLLFPGIFFPLKSAYLLHTHVHADWSCYYMVIYRYLLHTHEHGDWGCYYNSYLSPTYTCACRLKLLFKVIYLVHTHVLADWGCYYIVILSTPQLFLSCHPTNFPIKQLLTFEPHSFPTVPSTHRNEQSFISKLTMTSVFMERMSPFDFHLHQRSQHWQPGLCYAFSNWIKDWRFLRQKLKSTLGTKMFNFKLYNAGSVNFPADHYQIVVHQFVSHVDGNQINNLKHAWFYRKKKIRIANKENHTMLSGHKILKVLGRDRTHVIVKHKLMYVMRRMTAF